MNKIVLTQVPMKCAISTRPKEAKQQKTESILSTHVLCHPNKSPMLHFSALLPSSKPGINASREIEL